MVDVNPMLAYLPPDDRFMLPAGSERRRRAVNAMLAAQYDGQTPSYDYDFQGAPLSPAVEAFKAQRGQPGVIQKTLGLVPGFDQSGKRVEQSWTNALMSTVQFPIDMIESAGQALTAPVRAYRGEFDPTSEQGIGEALNVAGTAMTGGLLSRPGAAAGAVVNSLDNTNVPGIRAYHGSPHDFDRFDLSKAGTGVGFKSYGHGVDLTRSEEVGNIYKHALADPDGGPLRLNANPDGHIYEVNVNVSPTELMDWNKRIADQPYVSERVPPQYHDMTGGAYHDILEADLKAKAKEDYKAGRMSFFRQPDYKKQIADDLLARGIKGVSYVDSDPKVSLGSGASNLTIFDPKLIDILRKYGLLGMAGGAAVNEMMSGAQDAPRRNWSNAMLPGDA